MLSDDKETYETMEMLSAAVPIADRPVLAWCWRRRVCGVASRDDWARALAKLPGAFRDAFHDTLPSAALLARWERDHGFAGPMKRPA